MLWRRRSPDPSASPRTVRLPFEDGHLDVTSAPGAPADADESAHQDFLAEGWPSLAAASFEGWQRFGVGAVVVEADVAEIGVGHPFLAPRLLYATSFGPWLARALKAEPLRAWLDAEAEHYDPRATALFLFVRDGHPPRAYRAQSTLAPAAALRRVRALLN